MVPKTAKVIIAKKPLKRKHHQSKKKRAENAQEKLLDSLSHKRGLSS